ncbi:hypothetical protein D3C87_2151520 [compost metagenome]
MLSYATLGDHTVAQMARGDWESAGVELTAVAVGVLSAWAAIRMWKKPQSAPAQRTPRATQKAAA